ELLDVESWQFLAERHYKIALETGALTSLAPALTFLATADCMHSGDLSRAAELNAELEAIASSAGSPALAYGTIGLAAWRGARADRVGRREAGVQEGTVRGEGRMITFCGYAASVLYNGLGEYQAALDAAADTIAADELILTPHTLPELIEAAIRLGRP